VLKNAREPWVRMHVCAYVCITSLLIRQRAHVYVCTASCECAYTCALAVEIYAALRCIHHSARARMSKGPCVTFYARKRRPTPLLGPGEFTWAYSAVWRCIDILMGCEKLTRDDLYMCIVKDLSRRTNFE